MRLLSKFPGDMNRPDFYFFDAFNDDTQNFSNALLELVYGLRRTYSKDLEEIIKDANSMVLNYENEQVKAVQQQVAARLKVWLKSNQQVHPTAGQVTGGFLNHMRVPYASSVRASIWREGDWYNLDYHYQLGYQARLMATGALKDKLMNFRVVAENLLADPEIEDAHGLVREATRIIESGEEALLRKSQSWGNSLHDLMKDHFPWIVCENEWGQGPGYRERVISHHRDWFAGRVNSEQADIQRIFNDEWKQTLARLEAILEEN